jgi:SAM-dependent methyltransferase
MKTVIHRNIAKSLGVNPALIKSLRYIPRFVRDLRKYSRGAATGGLPIRIGQLYPIVSDYKDSAGSASGHYFHQDLWAARKIYRRRPSSHVDIGSRIDGFIAHLLPFMPVDVIDIRPLNSRIEGLRFVQDDATELRSFADGSVESLSSLHAAEHFGLGRYGDPIDPLAHVKFMKALGRVLAPGGRLYFSLPVGEERLQFNAHRILSPHTVLAAFAGLLLVDFAYVDDKGDLCLNGKPEDCEGLRLGCGLFEFTRDRV